MKYTAPLSAAQVEQLGNDVGRITALIRWDWVDARLRVREVAASRAGTG